MTHKYYNAILRYDTISYSNNTKFVVGHYPITSLGIYGINKKLFLILFPIFKKYNVSYYISGHDHNLQIVDIYSKDYSLKQIVSAGSSSLYPTLSNSSSKVFSKFGTVVLNSDKNTVRILDIDLNTLHEENLLLKKIEL